MNLQEENFASRKGATKPALVPAEVLALLEAGKLETVNLSEWLALDQTILLGNVLSEYGLYAIYSQALKYVGGLPQKTSVKVSAGIASFLNSGKSTCYGSNFWHNLSTHRSDTVRSWAALMAASCSELSLKDKFREIKHFAADHHFAVREMAWLGLRSDIISQLNASLSILALWSLHPDENVRRFASESTRPRGVWCKHIDVLKLKPEAATDLLEPLKDDPSAYVQKSVANWLNDAGKTRPDWLVETCERWLHFSPVVHTRAIVKRAMRNAP